jgi:hypothetical protein
MAYVVVVVPLPLLPVLQPIQSELLQPREEIGRRQRPYTIVSHPEDYLLRLDEEDL